MNIENFNLVLAKIKSCPLEWDQKDWHNDCNTTHCFAGHAQLMLGKAADKQTVKRDARIFLGLSQQEANYFFAGGRTLEDFEAAVDFDSAGYSRAGYDRAGYSRDGYDRDGYDRDGYDRAGYSRAGYSRAGYSRDGYDRDGYDRDGYDCAGLDKDNKPKPDAK